MAVKTNVAHRNIVLDTYMNPALAAPNGGLKLYTGTQPALGGGSHSDTLIATNLNFTVAAAVNGIISMTDVTGMTVDANGTIGWGRIGGSSGQAIDFSITNTGGGGDMTMGSTTVTTSDTIDISNFKLAIAES